jgi:phage terminase large subunit-like protein
LTWQGVEDTSNGSGIIQQGAAEGYPFKALKGGGVDKVVLAGPISTMYENGKVFHRRPGYCVAAIAASGQGQSNWLVDYEDELLNFPKGDHDDMVDVASYAGRVLLERAMTRARIVEWNPEEIPDLKELLGGA